MYSVQHPCLVCTFNMDDVVVLQAMIMIMNISTREGMAKSDDADLRSCPIIGVR